MSKDCLVSFSSKGRENYNKKLLKLLDSAIEHWKGDYLIYSPDHELSEYRGIKIHKGWPGKTHAEVPYGFKYDLIKKALELGYERIVWLDTSMTLAKDITPLFDRPVGLFHNLGHPLYKYMSDECQMLMGVSDSELMEMKQVWGGALFFDFNLFETGLFFDHIMSAIDLGAFNDGISNRDGFVAHRHDQSVLSVLAHDIYDLYEYGKIKIRQHYLSGEYGNDCYLVYG